MAGIGEATAVFGVAQLGYSIAKTLITYINDVRDAEDDVRDLATSIESSLLHLDELNKLTIGNVRLQEWPEGQRLIENCHVHSRRVVDKLTKLLNIGDVAQGTILRREQIDLSPLQRAAYPAQKREVLILRQELHWLTPEIQHITLLCQAKLANKSDRRALLESIGALERVKKNAARKLHHIEGATRSPHVRFDDTVNAGAYEDYLELYENIKEEVRKEEHERREQVTRTVTEDEQKLALVKTKAVKDYQQSLRVAVEQYRRDVEKLTGELRDSFNNAQESKINEFVESHVDFNGELKELMSLSRHEQAVEPSMSGKSSRWPLIGAILNTISSKPAEIPRNADLKPVMIAYSETQWKITPIDLSKRWLAKALKRQGRGHRSLGALIDAWRAIPHDCLDQVIGFLMAEYGYFENYRLALALDYTATTSPRQGFRLRRSSAMKELNARLDKLEAGDSILSEQSVDRVFLLAFRHSPDERFSEARRSAAAAASSRASSASSTVSITAEPSSDDKGQAAPTQENDRTAAAQDISTESTSHRTKTIAGPVVRRRTTQDDAHPTYALHRARSDSWQTGYRRRVERSSDSESDTRNHPVYAERRPYDRDRDTNSRTSSAGPLVIREKRRVSVNGTRRRVVPVVNRHPRHSRDCAIEERRSNDLDSTTGAEVGERHFYESPIELSSSPRDRNISRAVFRSRPADRRESVADKRVLQQMSAQGVDRGIAEDLIVLHKQQRDIARSHEWNTQARAMRERAAREVVYERLARRNNDAMSQAAQSRADEVTGAETLRQHGIDDVSVDEESSSPSSHARHSDQVDHMALALLHTEYAPAEESPISPVARQATVEDLGRTTSDGDV